jgi:hypothetical protein
LRSHRNDHNGRNYRAGLFRRVTNGSIIKNLGLVDVDISARSHTGTGMTAVNNIAFAGAIAGEIRNSTIINCFSTGSIYSRSWMQTTGDSRTRSGGLVGAAFDSSISFSYSEADVHADTHGGFWSTGWQYAFAGGIVGHSENSLIYNCYSRGTVRASGVADAGNAQRRSYAGGIAGRVVGTSNPVGFESPGIKQCFATGHISASAGNSNRQFVGGIVGEGNTLTGIIFNLWDQNETGVNHAIGHPSQTPNNNRGLSTAQAKDKTFFTLYPYNWDFTFIWAIGSDPNHSSYPDPRNDGYPWLYTLPDVIPPPTNPKAPLFVRASLNANGNVVIEWDEPLSAPPDAYLVFRNGVLVSQGNPDAPFSLNRNSRSWTDHTIPPANVRVFYEVGAYYSYIFETKSFSGFTGSASLNAGVSVSHSLPPKTTVGVDLIFAQLSVEKDPVVTIYSSIETSLVTSMGNSQGLTHIEGPDIRKAGVEFIKRVAPQPVNLEVIKLDTSQHQGDILLTWQAPDLTGYNSPLIGYRIYRDGDALNLGTENLLMNRRFYDNVFASGLIVANRYTYFITAIYENGEESRPSNIEQGWAFGGVQPPPFSNDESGNAPGSQLNPFRIYNLGHLRWVSEFSQFRGDGGWWTNTFTPVYIVQMGDIDARQTEFWNGGYGFRPIGRNEFPSLNMFIGVYDGQGHKIHNLHINAEGRGLYPVGLFSSLNSTANHTSIIRNVHLVNANIRGSTIVGGLVGEMSLGSMVENSSVNGTIFGYATVGGIAGLVRNDSIIRNSFTEGTITGNAVGGIAGTLNSSTIRDSYSKASTIGGYNGGLAGLTMNSSIINSYSIGNNNDFGTGFGGRIGGYTLKITDVANPHLNNISNSFWEINLTHGSDGFGFISQNTSPPINALGKTTEEMKQASTFIDAGWDFETIWDICPDFNDGYPYLRAFRTGIRITPAVHDFGNITIGETVQQTFTIENLGRNNVIVSNIIMSGANQNEFDLIGATGFPWTIPANEPQTFLVAFSPISIGAKTARVSVTHDTNGSPSVIELMGGGSVSEDDYMNIPNITALMGNFPNPFNPETTISFSLAESGDVSIEIFNVRGQKVRNLLNIYKDIGNHTVHWDGRDNNGIIVGSGVFFYKMNVGEHQSVRRMVLMK